MAGRTTPEDHEWRFTTAGRPHSDWEALRDLWYASPGLRARGFFTLSIPAEAEPNTQRTATGRDFTRLIHQRLSALGYAVTPEPHFVRR